MTQKPSAVENEAYKNNIQEERLEKLDLGCLKGCFLKDLCHEKKIFRIQKMKTVTA